MPPSTRHANLARQPAIDRRCSTEVHMRGDASFIHGLAHASTNPQPRSVPFSLALEWQDSNSHQLLRALEPHERFEVGDRVNSPDGTGTIAACVAIQNPAPMLPDGQWTAPVYVVIHDEDDDHGQERSPAIFGGHVLRKL